MNEKYRWIIEHLEEFKQAIEVMDFCKKHRIPLDDRVRDEASEISKSLALSFLFLLMGDNIPKEVYTVDDYSELYSVLMDNRDRLNLRDFY